ncbi:hypothetical protein H3H37_10510 [Duganella sp. LX20W]|uniref:DEC-1 protein N-terminal domain-containing protein n=1 Tax=Rugamonas brunnea TaxID=2758569 RepID=A0A7W2IBT9_9BURK|nr:hypothetical protein [Rugamonas brunnea]MBA5637485.1 hypothetical protein [Rugamonas brunnea]
MKTSIYDKTAKGREEIATRRYQLAPRLRTLLVMVDGHRPEDELLRNVAGLGLTADAMQELLAQQFIVLSTSYSTIDAPLVEEAEMMAAPATMAAAAPAPALAAAPPMPASAPAMPPPAPAPAAPAAPARTKAEQFQALYDFYNKTIKSTIGLRGFTLQLKVEKAACVEDFRDLRRPYLEAVLKAKGSELAQRLGEQLDQLLGERSDDDLVR